MTRWVRFLSLESSTSQQIRGIDDKRAFEELPQNCQERSFFIVSRLRKPSQASGPCIIDFTPQTLQDSTLISIFSPSKIEKNQQGLSFEGQNRKFSDGAEM